MAFKDNGEEVAFFSRVTGILAIIAAPFAGPAAPIFIGIGSAAIAGASVGTSIANRTTRKKNGRHYEPSTEETVSSLLASGVTTFMPTSNQTFDGLLKEGVKKIKDHI